MCLAIPGQIRQLDPERRFATVEVGHVRRSVNVDLLRDEPLDVDDWVLIHVGFAMSKISAKQAASQIALLEMLGEADEALEEVQGYAFGAPTGLPPQMLDRMGGAAPGGAAASGDGAHAEPQAP
jgi:hydrogenase expression/formation protein HypC